MNFGSKSLNKAVCDRLNQFSLVDNQGEEIMSALWLGYKVISIEVSGKFRHFFWVKGFKTPHPIELLLSHDAPPTGCPCFARNSP